MTTRVSPYELICSKKIKTCGSEPCHNFDPTGVGFDPPENLERRSLLNIGERGVVGVVAVDSLGTPSESSDSGGGDGLWRNCPMINLGSSNSASRSSTPT